MSFRGRGRGGFAQNSQNTYDSHAASAAVPVEISGWNGLLAQDCISFISRKTRVIVSDYAVDPASGLLKGTVKSRNAADDLLRWQGVKFAGQSLKFSAPAVAAQAGLAIDAIRSFLSRRYDPQSRLLNLAAVQQDQELATAGFFGNISTTSKFFAALIKVATDAKLDVLSVDLSANNLRDLVPVSGLAQAFPRLQNLALSGNTLDRNRVFEPWRHKFNYLRQLVLTGNPIVSLAPPHEIATLKLELLRCFPRLIIVDGETLRNEEALIRNTTFPFGAPCAMFLLSDDVRATATGFLANYLKFWDTDRNSLLMLYTADLQFSYLFDASHPHLLPSGAATAPASTRFRGGRNNDPEPATDFGHYLPNSRNLTRVSTARARASRVARGPQQTASFFALLPKTQHDLISRPENYSMEAYPYPALGGIIISLHGSFEEVGDPESPPAPQNQGRGQQRHKKIALLRKSFDRSFVVVPGPNGSMIIASDMLLVRPYVERPAWNRHGPVATPGPVAAAPAAPGVGPSPLPGMNAPSHPGATPIAQLPPHIDAQLAPMQKEVLQKVLAETRLTLEYGLMLCEQSQWDYTQCGVNFKNSAGLLPPAAFSA